MSITRPLGFRASAATAGLKPSGKPDLALIVCDPASENGASRSSAAAVFTRNAVVGAPVEIGRVWRDKAGKVNGGLGGNAALRSVLVNAGCSNAATGEAGIADARRTMETVAAAVGCTADEVMPSSTGIIGRRLRVDLIERAMSKLAAGLSRGPDADAAAAAAIMTTDLVPKSAHREVEIAGHVVHIGAIAKGSGMIAPRLDGLPQATMLGFITTDAAIPHAALQAALAAACHESFDRVSVDAHPSCSDTVIAMASGAAPVGTIYRDTPEFAVFRGALTSLCEELAEKVVRDGEGATRVFRVSVRGAKSVDEAERLARAVVDSPLVKCAIHGKDPNWGRIVTAAGNAGVWFDTRHTSLSLGGIEVYRAGLPTGVDPKDAKLKAAMDSDPVEAVLTVGDGPGQAWLMGCDLSAEYVRINADYTT